MMNRRTFLKTSAGAAVGSLVTGTVHTIASTLSGNSLKKIGVQLYTVRSLMEKDFAGTLEKVAQAGYKEVEFAGYYDNKPEEVRKLLDRLGLKAPAAHIPLSDFSDSKIEATIAAAKVVGHQYLVCPWLNPLDRVSLEKYKGHAAAFNKAGAACKSAEIQFAYHNHDFEFQAIDGKMPYDVLLAETDPALVKMELDLFWIKKAGQEPLAYFEKYPGRFELCHVKDMDEQGKMTEVGNGKMDFGKIFAQARQAGLKHFFVEHDEPADPLQSITVSCQYLKKLKF